MSAIIQLQNIRKTYFMGTHSLEVLKGISLEVKSGETIAIVGSTGSGKTSTISVLNRMYEINKGIITIDGINIHDYTLASLRSHWNGLKPVGWPFSKAM